MFIKPVMYKQVSSQESTYQKSRLAPNPMLQERNKATPQPYLKKDSTPTKLSEKKDCNNNDELFLDYARSG